VKRNHVINIYTAVFVKSELNSISLHLFFDRWTL